ncbi:hypothetical protein A0H81_01266 [Grifola frondosa]|uniref:Uncharacterized protein n=1 Tax=Grifola frondosa TaxID=5627 RepID=A0A1C7MRF2_GRIFR|nr:hypothetical protein A0H81_01266 [Grifola frondosa]
MRSSRDLTNNTSCSWRSWQIPSAIAEVLADDTPGESKTCADLGLPDPGIQDTGRCTGLPHCSAVAIDLVPMQDVNILQIAGARLTT